MQTSLREDTTLVRYVVRLYCMMKLELEVLQHPPLFILLHGLHAKGMAVQRACVLIDALSAAWQSVRRVRGGLFYVEML